MLQVYSAERCLPYNLYRNNLKNRGFGKEALQNLPAEQTTIVRTQGASEQANFEEKSTQPKTDSSGCFGIHAAIHGQIRLAMLKRSDQFLDIITPQKFKYYCFTPPSHHLINPIPSLVSFAEDFGYFSPVRPIIAHVSNQREDLELVLCMLKVLSTMRYESEFVTFAIAELIAKALAYRDLNQGQRVRLPVKTGSVFYLTEFTVDRVFNLWNGMPAFGLIPDTKGIASILLFRGTDFALYSKRGWSSLLSDVDLSGPGFSVFMNARSEIHTWLEKSAKEDKKAIVLGLSLGGALAAYTYIYEGDLLNETGSASFNAPGIPEKVFEEWDMSPKKRGKFISYINQGDIVSKNGYLFGEAVQLSIEVLMKPIVAHTILISGQSNFTMTTIDVQAENAQRSSQK
jgi:hypothetical protein